MLHVKELVGIICILVGVLGVAMLTVKKDIVMKWVAVSVVLCAGFLLIAGKNVRELLVMRANVRKA